MAVDYDSIRAENKRRYGTDIGRIGPMLLADRYDDRAHFIYELLQNAEDALARRIKSKAPRSITFALSPNALRVSHFGAPFTEADVRRICGIGEGAKDPTAIGRFGIGFKSVYAFTARPEIHSAGEHFAIESFVWPTLIARCAMRPDETVFILPLARGDATAPADITRGLRRLGPRVLLFLRQIEEIAWSVEGGASGLYLRSKPQRVGKNARRVVVSSKEDGAKEVVEEAWLVFSREVRTAEGARAGWVELAFALTRGDENNGVSVRPVDDAALVVFFPTVVPTHLGFLVQGPYRTTPSRDNILRHDPWNEHLVREAAALLVEALHSLRDVGLLDTGALGSLPLDRTKFGEGHMFTPLFDAVREALSSEALLPRFGGGYASAKNVRLARTQELRELVSPSQLAQLFGEKNKTFWLSEDITPDRTPELRQYLMSELGIIEGTPEIVLTKLNEAFLEKQSDKWILRLYEFLHGQPALSRHGRLADLPLVRLEDGHHVTPQKDGQSQAFLPGATRTDFPTVRASVCATERAREFLGSLGLTEPDPVDDVVHNVLPKYRMDEVDVSDAEYETDIRRILTAFATDSKGQREKLIAGLREAAFVKAVDAGDGSKYVSQPENVYLATGRLKELFAGVAGVLLVDDSYRCICGEDMRELLEACGATCSLQPIVVEADLSSEQRREIRRNAGLERQSWERPINDATLRGLDMLLNLLVRLEPEVRRRRAAILWEALIDVENRRGSRVFLGEYMWGYSHTSKTATFEAAFVRQLNATAWVPAAKGELERPESVVFDTLGWKPHPFLQSNIRFKPALLDQLAKEAGIEPGVLDLLKKLGMTSEADLRDRLGLEDEPARAGDRARDAVENALKELLGNAPGPTPPVPEPASPEVSGSGAPGGGSGAGAGARTGVGSGQGTGAGGGAPSAGRAKGSGPTAGKGTSGGAGGRPFTSYVGVHPGEEEPDPDGLDRSARMALEAQAIDLILSREPHWRRTPTHNPGYDLYEADEHGGAARWCEVKAMTGSLDDRPVGLSRTQFECAREHREAYWLYVVEHAGEDSARIVRIQDPAGKARSFTFDHGWLGVADVDTEQEDEES